MAGTSCVSMFVTRVAYRPQRYSPRHCSLITAIGASLFLQNSVKGFFGPQSQGYPTFHVIVGYWKVAGIPILRVQVLVIVAAVLAMVGLMLFVAKTKTGKSMRAVAEDKEIASLMGIDVDKVIVKTFAIGG